MREDSTCDSDFSNSTLNSFVTIKIGLDWIGTAGGKLCHQKQNKTKQTILQQQTADIYPTVWTA